MTVLHWDDELQTRSRDKGKEVGNTFYPLPDAAAHTKKIISDKGTEAQLL